MAAKIRTEHGSPHWSWEAGKFVCTVTLRVTFPFNEASTGPGVYSALSSAGYTAYSALPADPSLSLMQCDLDLDRESARIWTVKLTYKAFESDPNKRPVNAEVIERDNSCDSHLEYYDTSFAPLDNGNGSYGVMIPSPKSIIRVKRIHSSTREATWAAIGAHLNSAQPVTTPGGVTLSTVVGQLLFIAAPERQLDNGNIEVMYTFSKDLATFNSNSATTLLLHREPIAVLDKTGRITNAIARDVIPKVSFSGLMADET